MAKENGTLTVPKVEVPKENFQQIPAPTPIEVLSAYPINLQGMNTLFTLNIQSDGKVSLTIRTDDEEELGQLIERWEPRIVVLREEPVNGNGKRYYAGDTCPQCSGKLVTRQGRTGKFVGCNQFPDCKFTA